MRQGSLVLSMPRTKTDVICYCSDRKPLRAKQMFYEVVITFLSF